MDDMEFDDRVDKIIEQVEDELDELEADLDIESSAGVLTVNFPDGSTVILSRQSATHEIWIAARSGGFHLRWVDEQWQCQTTSETLSTLLGRVFTEQLQEPVSLL
jgi:CyaY protein